MIKPTERMIRFLLRLFLMRVPLFNMSKNAFVIYDYEVVAGRYYTTHEMQNKSQDFSVAIIKMLQWFQLNPPTTWHLVLFIQSKYAATTHLRLLTN